MAYKRNTIVKQAQSWIGCKESDGTHKEIIDVYNAHTPLARSYKVQYTDAWCATFVSAVSIKCGYTEIIPTECSCSKMITLFKNLNEWEEDDSYTPSPGDIIFYDWQDSGSGDNTGTPDHVGIVEKISGTTITVIEGNKDDAVARRTMQVNGKYIRGYGLPKYTDSTTSSSTTVEDSTLAVGTKVALKSTKLYSSATATTSSGTKTGTYYIWSATQNNKRIRITTKESYVGVANQITGWVNVSDISEETASETSTSSKKVSYTVGKVYTTQVDRLTVRTDAGTSSAKVTYGSLTANARANAYNNGTLKKGTGVTCKATKTLDSDVWMQIPSGWIAAYYNGEYYVK